MKLIQRSSFAKNEQQGFALVEVLLATVVVALALTAAVAASTQGVGAVASIKQKTLAHIVASNTLTELQMRRIWPKSNRKQDKVEMAGIRWRVVVETEKTAGEELFKDRIVQATVSVADDAQPDRVLHTMSGFLVNDQIQGSSGPAQLLGSEP